MNILRKDRNRIFRIASALALALLPAGFLYAGQMSAAQTEKQIGAHQLVSEMVKNEIRAQKGDQMYWRYREIKKGSSGTKIYEICETPEGNVRMLIGTNGQPLSPSQRQSQEARLRKLLKHPAPARKAAKQRNHDGNKEQKLLGMLPNAFLFRYDGTQGKLVRVKFRPNPSFSPPTREAQVFHHMSGKILIDPGPKRLVEISGRLMSEVKFFWGLLGHLDKGGTFRVKQVNLGNGHWEMSLLHVNMHGKALFFETIGVQEDNRYENYRANPSGITLKQAVALVEKTSYSSANAKPSGRNGQQSARN